MITFEGHYFDGYVPIPMNAKMDFMDRHVILTAGLNSNQYEASEVKVTPRVGTTDRFIILPNGGQFACSDHDFLNTLPQESSSEGVVAWLEERWGVALASVAIILCILIIGYFFGLPAAAERLAAHIPMETEQILGDQALTWLDVQGWFKKTETELNTREEITEGFAKLCSELPLRDFYHLEFRSGGSFGANAVALPGGIIVITDQMVEVSENMEEVLAVLAHEIGHVELRHTMRSVLQNSVIGVVVATVTSDAATLSAVVSGLPMVVAQTKYSRDFESEADEYAFWLLKEKGYSPAAFASIMERLANANSDDMGYFSWLSTHPITSERVQRARDSAAE